MTTKGEQMVRRNFTPEQIINKLREAEVLLSQGATLDVVWKKIGVSDCTYYRWRNSATSFINWSFFFRWSFILSI